MAADVSCEIDSLLNAVAARVRPEALRRRDERLLAALRFETVDRPPIVARAVYPDRFVLPKPWSRYRRFTAAEAFTRPEAMLTNELLEHVVPSLLIGDDHPLAIRANFGTIQTAAALGASWTRCGDQPPWVEPLTAREKIERLVYDERAVADETVRDKTCACMRFMLEATQSRPPLHEALQIAMPDLQGPLDVAEQFWGADVFMAMHDNDPLLQGLLSTIAGAIAELESTYRPLSRDRLYPAAVAQHAWVIPGTLLLRCDSAIMVSGPMYRDAVLGIDAALLGRLGGGSLHFCGNGEHLLPELLEPESVRGLDLGQSETMDLDRLYAIACEYRKPLLGVRVTPEQLREGDVIRRFPTGVIFSLMTDDVEKASAVIAELS